MPWNLDTMNHQQVQQRPVAIANGVNRSRQDRDAGIRIDTSFRSDAPSWRSSQHVRHGPENVVAGSHGYVEHSSTSTSFPSGSRRHSTEKDIEDFRANPLGRYRGSMERPLHDRLLFLTMCLIGQPVEVQVKNGSIYSGIFHTANADKDFGVVLKMARLTKDGSAKGGKSDSVKEAARKPPVKTLIIYEKDFVQIIAKDVSLTADSYTNGRTRENKTDILTDSVLSEGRSRDMERELKPWKPDNEAPRNLGLDSTFQSSWNRNWDQFETNKTLFGVESTFDEDLYTTKLERGPQTRDREREACRIAKEIEGKATRNRHLAEERGIDLASELDHLDEESRFASVSRPESHDTGKEDGHNNIDKHNEETFGDSHLNGVVGSQSPSSSSTSLSSAGEREHKAVQPTLGDPKQVLSHSEGASGNPQLPSPANAEPASIEAFSLNTSGASISKDIYREVQELKSPETSRKVKNQWEDEVADSKCLSESLKDRNMDSDQRRSKAVGAGGKPFPVPQEGSADKVLNEIKSRSSTPAPVAFTPPAAVATASSSTSTYSATVITHNLDSAGSPSASTFSQITDSRDDSLIPKDRCSEESIMVGANLVPETFEACEELSAATVPLLTNANRVPENASVGSTSYPIPSSSSSAILASQPYAVSVLPESTNAKKSVLNPNAKEFRLNPNAKAFTPTLSAARPPSPIHQGPVYVAAGLHPITPVQVPVGLGLSQIVQQSVQPAQLSQYNSTMAVASAAPYMQPHGAFLPNIGGAAGPPVLPVQATIKMPPQTQHQVNAPPYAQHQTIRYLPQGTPLQPNPAYAHTSGQLYQQQVMYGQPAPFLYIQQFPQGILQGQPLPLQHQGPLPPQQASQQPNYRGGGIEAVHFNVAPTYVAGQTPHLQQSHIAHLHNPHQTSSTGFVPGAVPGPHPSHGVVTVSGTIQDTYSILGGNGPRLGGKNSSGSVQLRY